MLVEKNYSADFLSKTIDIGLSDVTRRRRSAVPAWDPNISVLELAHRLKQAEHSVFGLPMQSADGQSQIPQSATSEFVVSDVRSLAYPGNSHTKQNSLEYSSTFRRPQSLAEAYNLHMPMPLMYSDRYRQQMSGGTVALSEPALLSSALQHHAAAQLAEQQSTDMAAPPYKAQMVPSNAGTLVSDAESVASSQQSQSYHRHQCQQCPYSTKSLHHMRRHCASVHTQTKPYQCYVCSMEFTRSEKVRDHFVSFHPDITYNAKLVRNFGTPSASPVQSTEPVQPTDTKSRIRALFQNIDGEDMEFENDPERPFGCLRCSYASRDLWHLRRHVFDVHAAKKQYTCRICRYATNRVMRLHAHMRGHGELFCDYCGEFSTTQPDYFALHDRLCGGMAAATAHGYRCRACGFDCESRSGLRQHSVDRHGVKLASCDQCPYFAYTSDEFVAHVDAHEAVTRTCQLCGLTFATHVERDQHDILAHLVSRPGADGSGLACGICAHISEPRGNLESALTHVRQHVPETVACTEPGCNFKSILLQSLEMHLRYYHAALMPPSTADTLLPRPKVDPILVNASMMPVGPKPVVTSSYTSLVGTFSCSVCGPKRTPFKYWRSYEKHMAQHGLQAVP